MIPAQIAEHHAEDGHGGDGGHGEQGGHDGHEARHLVHMPSPTPLPLIIGVAAMVASYAAIYKVWWLAVLAVLSAFYGVFRLMYDRDPGYFVEPKGDVE